MAPPNTTSTWNRRGLYSWSSFRRFPGSWRKCNTLPGASGIRTRERRSPASGSLRRRWWTGYAWWPSRSSPSSAPSRSSCQLPISLRLCPKTSHKADACPVRGALTFRLGLCHTSLSATTNTHPLKSVAHRTKPFFLASHLTCTCYMELLCLFPLKVFAVHTVCHVGGRGYMW